MTQYQASACVAAIILSRVYRNRFVPFLTELSYSIMSCPMSITCRSNSAHETVRSAALKSLSKSATFARGATARFVYQIQGPAV
jgi:hypothetical protein